MKRRAQVKMFETMGVLVVFFFLIVAGASFYFNIQKSSLQKELLKQEQLKSIQIVEKALYLPELDCSFVSVQKSNCFDKVKLRALGRHLGNPAAADYDDYLMDYFDLFGFSNIVVKQIYPVVEDEIVVYNNVPDKYRSIISTQSPVLLFDPVKTRYNFGVIEVNAYAEQ